MAFGRFVGSPFQHSFFSSQTSELKLLLTETAPYAVLSRAWSIPSFHIAVCTEGTVRLRSILRVPQIRVEIQTTMPGYFEKRDRLSFTEG